MWSTKPNYVELSWKKQTCKPNIWVANIFGLIALDFCLFSLFLIVFPINIKYNPVAVNHLQCICYDLHFNPFRVGDYRDLISMYSTVKWLCFVWWHDMVSIFNTSWVASISVCKAIKPLENGVAIIFADRKWWMKQWYVPQIKVIVIA